MNLVYPRRPAFGRYFGPVHVANNYLCLSVKTRFFRDGYLILKLPRAAAPLLQKMTDAGPYNHFYLKAMHTYVRTL